MANDRVPMTESGFCLFPGPNNGHQYCTRENCTCKCHKEDK